MRSNRSFFPRVDCTPSFLHDRIIANDTILSKHTSIPLDTRLTRRNNHILVVGDRREDILDSFVKPNILQGNASYVIHDATGELLQQLEAPLKDLGYEIRVLNLAHIEKSNYYNPFRYFRDDEDVLRCVKILLHDTGPEDQSADIFSSSSECLLLNALFLYVHSERIEEARNFSAVLDLVSHGETGSENLLFLDSLFEALEQKEPEHLAVRSYKAFRSINPSTTGSGYIHSVYVRLQMFRIPLANTLTFTDDIDLSSVGDKPVALFCIPNEKIIGFNVLIQMLYAQLFGALYVHAEHDCERCRLPRHVRVFLNDFEGIGWIQDLIQTLITMGKYNMSAAIGVSSLTSLKIPYPEDWEILMGYCDTHLFFGLTESSASSEDKKYIYGKCLNTSIQDLRQLNLFNQRSAATGDKYLVDLQPKMLFSMSDEDCIAFFHGERPIWDKRYL